MQNPNDSVPHSIWEAYLCGALTLQQVQELLAQWHREHDEKNLRMRSGSLKYRKLEEIN